MTPIHKNNLGTGLFLSHLKVFRLEMRRIRLSNLFHSVLYSAAKLKELSKNVLEQFLLSGGITNNK